MTILSRIRITRLHVALLVSLCLNVVLGSYVATQWLAPPPLIGAAGRAPGRLVEAIAARLPEADAARLRRVFAEKQPELAEAQAAYEQALRHAIVRLTEPHLDTQAFRAAVVEARDRRVAVGDIIIDSLVEAAVAMPLETRAALVGRLRRSTSE